MNRTRITAPATEPLTASSLRDHLHLDADDVSGSDSRLNPLISAATLHLERVTRRRFVTQTWNAAFDSFTDATQDGDTIYLPYSPVQSVSAVTYIDVNGTRTNCANTVYELGIVNGLSVLRLKYGQVWPSVRDQADAVNVQYVCGYGNAVTVPADLVHALKLLAATWYMTREAVNVGNIVNEMPFTVKALVEPFKVTARA